jgi:hypothetical protein
MQRVSSRVAVVVVSIVLAVGAAGVAKADPSRDEGDRIRVT